MKSLILLSMIALLSACGTPKGESNACKSKFNGKWYNEANGLEINLAPSCQMTAELCDGAYTYSIDEAKYKAYVASGSNTNCFPSGTTTFDLGVSNFGPERIVLTNQELNIELVYVRSRP